MAKRVLEGRGRRVVVLATLMAALAACGGDASNNGNLGDGGPTDAGVADGGGDGQADGGAGSDGGAQPMDGGVCTNDSQCALAHRCVLRRCRAHAGGTGTPCPVGNECAVDALCTGTTFASTGPICIRACQSTTCPGDYTCQSWERIRDGGAETVFVCLPRNAFGIPCRNGGDPRRYCTTAGQYCGARSHEVGALYDVGYCSAGDGCDFKAQTGCAANETCHPAGALDYDNERATLCRYADPDGGRQGDPCGSCRPGYRCISLSSRQSVCLKYCTPNDPTHNCGSVPALSDEIACGTGNHTPYLCPDGGIRDGGGADGGAAAARCYDMLSDAPPSLSSIPAGVCR